MASGNPMFKQQTAEARHRQAALEAYTDTRSQSVVARIAQKEVEGLRRREHVVVDTEALQNYAYQDNDTSFQEANFARLNRYISANHNDIYLKALRNKASSLVGENGQNISPRMLPSHGSVGGAFTGQSSSYLGGIKANAKQTHVSYPSYQSFASNSGGAVVSKRVAFEQSVVSDGAFVTAQQAKRMQQQQAKPGNDGRFMASPPQAQSEAARLALEGQQRAQLIADQQFAAQRMVTDESEDDSDRVLVQNNNTCIVSNSPLATAEYANSERLYEQEQEAAAIRKRDEPENYGPRTVISVHEIAPGHVPEELVDQDYVYSDDEIQAPDFLTEDVNFWDRESDLPQDNESLEDESAIKSTQAEQKEVVVKAAATDPELAPKSSRRSQTVKKAATQRDPKAAEPILEPADEPSAQFVDETTDESLEPKAIVLSNAAQANAQAVKDAAAAAAKAEVESEIELEAGAEIEADEVEETSVRRRRGSKAASVAEAESDSTESDAKARASRRLGTRRR